MKKSSMSDKKLSREELFEVLQREYIICELRSQIYPFPHHKQYWQKVGKQKKQKIIDIATKNQSVCIFDSPKIKQQYRDELVPEWGLPLFYYINDKQKDTQQKWDIFNYFARKSEVKIKQLDDNVVIAKVKNIDLKIGEVTVIIDNDEQYYPYSALSRVVNT